MGWLDSFLHPERGYQKAQVPLEKYYNQGQDYLQPYNQFGKDAYSNLFDVMKNLLNPSDLESDWIKNYNESPLAKNTEDIAKQRGLSAASSSGLLGSNTALDAIQKGTSQIALEDRQNHLNDLMQKYLAGAGIAGNIFNTGANTAREMSGNAINMGNNAAELAFGKKNAPGDLMSKMLGLIAGGASSWALGGK